MITVISISLFFSACMTQSYTIRQQSLPNSNDSYIVQNGDSLSSIAAKYNVDFREIAVLNTIPPPYRIYIGQPLRIPTQNSPVLSTPNSTNQISTQTRMRRLHPRFSKQSFSQFSMSSHHNSGICYPSILWQWPTHGMIEQTTSSTGTQSINIYGRYRQAIQASASGIVIYSGNGVNGYKNLIIIQHDNGFISTYSHNYKRRVIEGQQVIAGETIAEMGKNVQRYPMLHFEIRCQEKSVDPLFYLPR